MPTYVVTVPGNNNTGLLASLDECCTLLDLDLLSIDGDLDFGGVPWCSCERPAGGGVDEASSCGLQAPHYPLSHHRVCIVDGQKEGTGEVRGWYTSGEQLSSGDGVLADR
jgi:hypothetical protein